RSKLVLISDRTLLYRNDDPQPRLTLAELEVGSEVAVIGTDLTTGKELPARMVFVLNNPTIRPDASQTNPDSLADRKASAEPERSAISESAKNSAQPHAVTRIFASLPTFQATPRPRQMPGSLATVTQLARQRSGALRAAQSRIHFTHFSGGSPHEKLVALTFDDGPDPTWTPKILDILKREKVPATFFIIGSKAEKYPELVLREAAEGHDLGNHTYNHFQVNELDALDWHFEIQKTNQVLEQILGGPTRWFRAPGCHYTIDALQAISDLKMVRVDTTANSGDWDTHGPPAIISRTLSHLAPGAVILCHDRVPKTATTLPHLIRAIRQRGYRFVSLTELAVRAQATPNFQPEFWPTNQGIMIEGPLPMDEDLPVLQAATPK
ncbi:MAG: polysaccharide deacetylase family protein, partial [Armatimonadota bacterium]|nr:polysaccharide deacetylase family protein [Armatimonadota bacterium]